MFGDRRLLWRMATALQPLAINLSFLLAFRWLENFSSLLGRGRSNRDLHGPLQADDQDRRRTLLQKDRRLQRGLPAQAGSVSHGNGAVVVILSRGAVAQAVERLNVLQRCISTAYWRGFESRERPSFLLIRRVLELRNNSSTVICCRYKWIVWEVAKNRCCQSRCCGGSSLD